MPAKTPVKKAVPAKAAVKPKAAKPKAAPKKPAPAAKKKVEAAPKEKLKKPKLVRDSFTMPEDEYQALVDIKKACIKAGFEIKKSELLRIGVALIRKTDPAQLKGLQAALPPLKAGRPKKDK
ncbi:MAG: hypothetical protein HYS18_15340 [Burkholderiales bacterium]|nr:hypothetical protein [Burkholderiales bacterium]